MSQIGQSTDESFEKVRSQEYETLREELNINRQFIFERPLLIVGVSFAALASVGEDVDKTTGLVQGLALFVVILLFFNLWFTFNRLKSNSRILGYLRVVHESTESVNRPGWENALSLQRRWLAANKRKHEDIQRECASLAMHDANRFYRGLFWFHLVMGLLALVLGLQSLSGAGWSVPGVVLEIAAGAVYAGGFVASLKRWNPHHPKNSIEVETMAWKEILGR